MIVVLLMLAAEPFEWEERSLLVTMAGSAENGPVSWAAKPSRREVARLYPKGYAGTGYAQITCRVLTRKGSLEGCRAEGSGYSPQHPFAPNPDFDAMGLQVVKLLRTKADYARRNAGRTRFVSISLRFSLGSHADTFGFCVPFCSPHFGRWYACGSVDASILSPRRRAGRMAGDRSHRPYRDDAAPDLPRR